MERPYEIGVVIPCFNSERSIELVVEDCIKELRNIAKTFEIVLVNDCSRDGTMEAIGRLCKRYPFVFGVDLAKNYGQNYAILAGLRHVESEVVVCMDDDGQTPPSEIPALVGALGPDVDLVFASYPEKHHSAVRNLGSRLYHGLVGYFTNRPKGLRTSSFWAAKWGVVDAARGYSLPNPYVSVALLSCTSHVAAKEVGHADRLYGKSGYSISKLARLCLASLVSSPKAIQCLMLFYVAGEVLSLAVLVGAGLGSLLGFEGLHCCVLPSLLVFLSSLLGWTACFIGLYVGALFEGASGIRQPVERSYLDDLMIPGASKRAHAPERKSGPNE